ncbi:hypothetical protein SKAU_G00384520 [Synaphobranchus kaupii]|uniref:Uncharacterized protein n=1 Tax=Synaphobranchus kaupii TaxID=118154 RepID=A0A9Q1IEZ8_SYNKA|nr:hypothetical protein SKAU_G00384520 [Synaphobranchus kaupii]
MSRVHYPDELSSEIKEFMSSCLALEVEDRATLEQLQRHPWLQPTCLAQVGFRKRKRGSEEDGEQKQKRSPSSPIPAKCPRKDQDGGHLIILHSPGGGGQGFEGEDLSQHGRLAPVLSLGHEQRGAHRSPQKPEPSEDERLNQDKIRQQFLSACSSLWTYYSCQSTVPETHQKIGLKRKMECEEQAVVLGKNLGPDSKTTPAKRPRKGPPSSCLPSTQPADPADTSPMLLSYSEPGALAFSRCSKCPGAWCAPVQSTTTHAGRHAAGKLVDHTFVIEGVSVLQSHQAREAVQETDPRREATVQLGPES